MVDEESDEVLYPRFQAGDTAAFKILFDRYLGRMAGFADLKLQNRAVSQEVAADALFAAYQARASIPDAASFRGFLRTVTRNRCIDLQRRKGLPAVGMDPDPKAEEEMIEPASPEMTVEERAIAKESDPRLVAVRNALARMTMREQRLFGLYYQWEMTAKEVARETKLSESQVETHLARARAKVAEEVEKLTGVIRSGMEA